MPEDAVLTLTLPVKEGLAQPNPQWGDPIAQALASAPAAGALQASFARQGPMLALAITGEASGVR